MTEQLARAYFLLQAVAVAGWWVVLFLMPGARSLFAMRDAPLAALDAFATGDLIVIAIGSAIVAFARRSSWSAPLAWIVGGAMLYGALYTVTAAILRMVPAWGMLLMVPAAVASLVSASILSRHARPEFISTGTSA